MLNTYDAIVVGGGAAGLTSAAYLCRRGCRTLLCEKSAETGGLVKTFWRNGFAFDAGIRAFENSGILFPMLKSLGLDIGFVKNTVSVGIGTQWARMEGRGSLHGYFGMLAGIFPEHRGEICAMKAQVETVIRYMDVLYGIDNPLFLDKPDRDYLMKTLLPWLVKYQVNIRKAGRLSEPVRAYLRRFTANEALIDMLIQHFFQQTPTFFALSYFGQYFDYSYPLGGTGVLTKKLTQYIASNGGTVMTGTGVVDVDARRKEIRTEKGECFGYKKLVWAADLKLLYNSLRPEPGGNAAKHRALVNESRGGDSVLAVFMGVAMGKDGFDNPFGPHAFFTPSAEGLSSLPDWQTAAPLGEGALMNWVARYLERTTYEISVPVLRDPSLAPEGKTGVIVSTLMDAGLVRFFSEAGAYDGFKRFCTEKISDMLETVIPGLRANTEFSLCATPLTIERETGNSDGAITGWAFTNCPFPSENRFKKIARSVRTPLEDIYQCGQWTFSPSGLPISILTGKLAADAVHKALKKR